MNTFYLYPLLNNVLLKIFSGIRIPIYCRVRTYRQYHCSEGKYMKMPKRPSEAVIRRKDNTVTKRKRTRKQIIVDKKLHRKLKVEQHEQQEVNLGYPDGEVVPAHQWHLTCRKSDNVKLKPNTPRNGWTNLTSLVVIRSN